MKKNEISGVFPEKAELTVSGINAVGRRRDYYISLGIFPGSAVTLFLSERNGMIIVAGKTKLALAGDAVREIKFNLRDR